MQLLQVAHSRWGRNKSALLALCSSLFELLFNFEKRLIVALLGKLSLPGFRNTQ